MNQLNSPPVSDWERLRPVIDEALDELSEPDREAVLLRFFENRPLAEVGARFSLSADAARMRIERALDKLRGGLARRGVASTSSALAAVFAGQSGLAAPVGLIDRIAGGVFSQTGAAGVMAFAGWKILAVGAAGVLTVGLILFELQNGNNEVYPQPNSASAALEPGSPLGSTAEARGAEAEATPPPTAPPAGPGSRIVDGKFAALSEMQQDLLKRLWDIQRRFPEQPSIHWGLKMDSLSGKSATLQPEVDWLQVNGWVAIGPRKGVLFLTKEGKAFCEAHAREVDAHSLVFLR